MISKQPRKQRKKLHNAPLHKRQKLVSVMLDKKLRKKFNRRSIPVRTGDKVEVLRGNYKGIRSNVKKVDLKLLQITLEEIKREKTDGTEIHVPFHPSNLKIIEPDMTDKKRQKIIQPARRCKIKIISRIINLPVSNTRIEFNKSRQPNQKRQYQEYQQPGRIS